MIDKLSYIFDEVRKNYDDSYWWHMRFENRVVGPVQQRVYGNDGIDVMEEDWDSLLVIDACRADIFEDTVDLTQFDDYRVVTSKASATPEWMERTFEGRKFGDTAYVSANPWVSKIAPDSFNQIYNIWLDEHDILQTEIAEVEVLEELGFDFGATITADKVDAKALQAAEERPNKRLIAHYFQPHAPYVGNPDGTEKENAETIHPGEPLKRGETTKEEVWRAYRENLEYVMEHALEVAHELPGKTVITSDHGELFGERLWPFPIRGYAHPRALRLPAITRVPWAVIDSGDRPEIIDDGIQATNVDRTEVNERLRDLGYAE